MPKTLLAFAVLIFGAAATLAWGAPHRPVGSVSGWYVMQISAHDDPRVLGGPYRSSEICETAALNLYQVWQGGGCAFFGKITPVPVIITNSVRVRTIQPPHEIH